MTTHQRTALIAEAVKRHDALEAAWKPLTEAVRNHDFPAFEESWHTFDAYLRALSHQIDDPFCGWLPWFIHDNDCGRKGMEAKAGAWKKPRPIKTPRDLARLIEADL